MFAEGVMGAVAVRLVCSANVEAGHSLLRREEQKGWQKVREEFLEEWGFELWLVEGRKEVPG